MLDSISFDWDPTVNEWESKFELLRLYKSINGNTNVPKLYSTKDGVRLGEWVSSQRSRKNRASACQINTLDSISFDWDPIGDEWESKFELLRQYKSINGNTNVPSCHATKEGAKLGEWVSRQRSTKNQKSKNQTSMLDSISFDWGPIMNKWDNKFELLCQYKSINGNTSVPKSYVTIEGVKLGAWVRSLRSRKNRMPTNRIITLESISFDWDPMGDEWENKFELLCRYKSINGNTNARKSYTTKEGVKLGEWVRAQRSRKDRMPSNRVTMLDSISFDWVPNVNEWGNKFELLQQYKSINGNSNVPKLYSTTAGVKLGSWVSTQRTHYRRNQLSTNRISLLESISFDWALKKKRKNTAIKVKNLHL